MHWKMAILMNLLRKTAIFPPNFSINIKISIIISMKIWIEIPLDILMVIEKL